MASPRDAVRKLLLESYLHKPIADTRCALCGRSGLSLALHVIEFYHPDDQESPSGFVPMSQSRSTTRGAVPACTYCARKCSRCLLPVFTPWTSKMLRLLAAQHPHVSFVRGNGICQHAHPLLDLLGLLTKAHLPSSPMTRKRDPVAEALSAIREIEAENLPAFDMMQRELVALVQDREKTTISIVTEGMHPKGLVFLLISNIAYRELTSGTHHIYRGALSMQGQMFRQAFETATRRMVIFRLHDKAKCEQDLKDIAGVIASAG
jgi:hypothetical protein